MDKQEQAMDKLERQGFHFDNWLPANPDADGEGMDDGQTAVMVKNTEYGHEYRQVEPDGTIN